MLKSAPYLLFKDWFTEASKTEDSYPEAFSLATASSEGAPSVRTVLLKKELTEGFVFFTNYNSQKSKEILENPHAQMLFYWKSLKKQIRISGIISKSSDEISNEYWNTRAEESNLNAKLSDQSSAIEDSFDYKKEVDALKKQSPNGVSRPENWGGFVITPKYFEFWQDGDFRWHKREAFKLDGNGSWAKTLLYP